ncbi:MAG TPA: TusE/DsrC/DsvC family sulfur relay protein [Gammaproteobacteria bacterium]|nr:TusE/DsrC/DsvC family sulfur relay protein [Gammaproteobacteria bacterium]
MAMLDRAGNFPFAPEHWDEDDALNLARQEGLELGPDHWAELRALQEYCAHHDCGKYSVRELHDALDEKFHNQGGYKYLYRLFPQGPIAQGCRLAGLEPPAGAIDSGFGSVV